MPYYTKGSALIRFTTARSGDLDPEFTAIETGFANASADIVAAATGSSLGFASAIDTRFIATDVGAADAIVFTPTPAPLATDSLVTGQFYLVLPNHACTDGGVTVTVGLIPGTKALKKANASGTLVDLDANDIVPNEPALIVYDGTQWLLTGLDAGDGKSRNLTADTNLQTWADTFPASGLYDIQLTAAQGNLPIGWWYIELVRHSSDAAGTVYHFIRATSLTGTANIVYLNTNILGTWSGWENAKGLTALNGKAIYLTTDTNLQTWADTLPDSGLYNLYLSVAQGNLPAGFWYIELIRHSGDSSSNLVHHMRATTLDITSNITYVNTRISTGWGGWKDTRALGDGQTWKDKTGTYLNHVTYTNNYGRTIALFARVESTAGGAFGIDTYINGFDAVKQTQYAAGALYHAISFVIVPDGQTFKFSTAAVLDFVSELS